VHIWTLASIKNSVAFGFSNSSLACPPLPILFLSWLVLLMAHLNGVIDLTRAAPSVNEVPFLDRTPPARNPEPASVSLEPAQRPTLLAKCTQPATTSLIIGRNLPNLPHSRSPGGHGSEFKICVATLPTHAPDRMRCPPHRRAPPTPVPHVPTPMGRCFRPFGPCPMPAPQCRITRATCHN
jgi:hypothetical protein